MVVLLRQTLGLEDDAQQGQAHFVAGAGAQLACGSVQGAVPLALRAEFLQMLEHACGQLGQASCGSPVSELVVSPQRAQHLGQMRLAAAVKARNPDPRLFTAGVQVQQELVEDGLQPFSVLAVANEGLQLVAQDGLRRLRVVFRHLSHAVVDEPVFLRGLVVDVPVQHGGPCFGSSVKRGSVRGQQRHGEVVPAIARVQQAIGVVLGVVFAGEEHQKPALHGFLDALDHG